VRVIVPSAAGGQIDVIGRIVADRLSGIWGKQAFVVNHPGAGGAIGVRAAGTSAPDGYSLFLGIASNFVALPELQATLSFDVARDFVPVGFIGEQPMAIAVTPALGVSSLAELIALAKKRPGEINCAVGTRGTLTHLTAERFRSVADADLTLIHYLGTPQALTDVVAGRVQVIVDSLSGLSGAIAGGSLKVLAVASPRRLPNPPDLPIVSETVPDFVAMGWIVLMAPPRTPEVVARKISNDLRSVLAQAEVTQRFQELGTYVRAMSPDELSNFIHVQQQTWKPIIAEIAMRTPK
jgi:tripartite-type tricarboxylate transporter receptor subunit TctC